MEELPKTNQARPEPMQARKMPHIHRLLMVALLFHLSQADARPNAVHVGVEGEEQIAISEIGPFEKVSRPKGGAKERMRTIEIDQLQVQGGSGPPKAVNCMKRMEKLEQQLVEQVIRQRVADKDHLLMEKWLVDNISDLHRELKQTEMDFEHYVRVTKNILLQNENHLKRQLAYATSLPLSIQLHTASGNHNGPQYESLHSNHIGLTSRKRRK